MNNICQLLIALFNLKNQSDNEENAENARGGNLMVGQCSFSFGKSIGIVLCKMVWSHRERQRKR